MGGSTGPALRLYVEPRVGGHVIPLGAAARTNGSDATERASEVAEVTIEAAAVAAARRVDMRRSHSLYAKYGKPMLDRLLAPVLAILTLPLCLVVAGIVRVTMGKGVFFRQERVGKDGQTFEVLKFRTMRHDRRASQQPIDIADRRRTHKHPNDPRHTRVGRFLRQSSLDELPQLENVMRGEMSLIGPRPELVALVEKYPEWQHARHAVRPGMTGLWQVSARGERTMQDCVDIDLDYVEQVSMWLDLRTALATPIAALGKRRGA
jgi:lipopolysaccharide/colanic/teichoic acid biosynthesis glycosyltransferase